MIPRRNKTLFVTLAMGTALLYLQCAISSLDTGGSSGTEVSALVGSVFDRNGSPVENAVVHLRPAEFLVDSVMSPSYGSTHSILDTVTGSDGVFSFSGVVPDSYSVEIAYGDSLGSIAELRITRDDQQVMLSPIVVFPLAELSGNIQINYGGNAFGFVQVYGLDRSVTPDGFGNFTIKVPPGKHRIHIGAYLPDSNLGGEFDGRDVSVEVSYGEQKDVGSFRLQQPPPPPCLDGTCDSAVVRYLLDAVGLSGISRTEVVKLEGGRVVELNLRGRNLSQGIPPDINKLSALRVLDLGQTGLPFIFPDMGRMFNLEIVRLDGNHIPIFSSSVGNLAALRELDLYGNELAAMPESIVKLTGLTYFNVGNNRLCMIDATMAEWIDRYDPFWRMNQRCQ